MSATALNPRSKCYHCGHTTQGQGQNFTLFVYWDKQIKLHNNCIEPFRDRLEDMCVQCGAECKSDKFVTYEDLRTVHEGPMLTDWRIHDECIENFKRRKVYQLLKSVYKTYTEYNSKFGHCESESVRAAWLFIREHGYTFDLDTGRKLLRKMNKIMMQDTFKCESISGL